MIRLHSLLCTAIIAVLLSATSGWAATRELSVATLRTAGTTPGGKASSNEASAIAELNEALTRELCRRLMARCVQHPLPFADILPGVESGRFQLGVANVLRTPEREMRVLFSQQLWRSSSRLIGTPRAIRSHSPAEGGEISLKKLRNVRIAVERGTQQQHYLSRLPAEQGLTVVESATVSESLRSLLDGRADFALMPIRSAYFLLAQPPSGKVQFVGPALTEQGLGGTVHIILPKNEAALCRDVDAALEAMRNDGTFQRIIRRYMPFLAD